jgi:four helix bundle protein
MFECLEVAHEALVEIGPVIERVARRDRDLANQLRRAASCIASNIDEGRGLVGAQRVHHYRLARGSANEVTTQLRIAVAWRYVAAGDCAAALALLDRVRAMLWRLIE